jgi:CubicO group peptidase (beta-lactamase class C family)
MKLLTLSLLLSPAFAMAEPLMQPERLQHMHQTLQSFVDSGKHVGISTLIRVKGQEVDRWTYGNRDLENKLPMQQDTICRVYSMSKIVTSVAVLMLMEDGKLLLEDPISKHLPEFGKAMVFKGGTVDAPELIESKTQITIKHLLSHTSGLQYDFDGSTLLHKIYNKADLWSGPDLSNFLAKAAKLPLKHEPGTAFTYGINDDVLGALVERLSGKDFATFLSERIFQPLGMKDTSFDVPAEKMSRVAKTYKHGPEGKNGTFEPAQPILATWPEVGKGVFSGGAGLFSTIDDYMAFASMLAAQGKTQSGRRLLSRKTVELMTANHLINLEKPHHEFNPSQGFGLGVEVQRDLGQGNLVGSPGAYGWYGAATTYCRIDPAEGTVAILFCQHFPYNEHKLFEAFATEYYSALP